MMLLLAFLSVLAFSNAIPVPSPGKELIYDYSARIRVGTDEPVSFASQFILDGKLHLQRENQNSTLLRFTDLTFKLYNGELNRRNEYESKALPLPQETADLLRIFRIEYDEDGKLRQLTTEAGEQRYVKNIKKAIASLLQLDRKNLQLENEIPNSRAFITEERGIYGRGLEEYNVEFQGNQILVQKMRNVKSSHHWNAYSDMNMEPIDTGARRNSPISAISRKLFTLIKNNDGGVDIKRLEAHGGIYVHMFRGLMDAQYISVNQTLNLIESIPIENVFRINNEERTNQIEFRFETETESGAVADLSFGRHTASQEQFVRLIQRALDDAITYLETNQLTLEAPDVRKGQAINRLQQLVGYLEISTLEQVYSTLEGNTGDRNKQILRIFQQILPQVGSRATTIFIKNLVKKNTLDEDLIIDMLNKMPLNLRMPSEKLLQEVEVLADLGNEYSLNIRRAGVLSFASLVHKVFAHRTHQHQQNLGNNQEQNLNSLGRRHLREDEDSINRSERRNMKLRREQNNVLDQYIKKFLNRLQDAQDYPTQLLNLQALYNIRVDVNRYLEKYVRGEGVNRHVQFLAMCASMAEDIKDPERVYQIYWPIFTNRKLHLELRAGAYFILMSTQVNMGNLWNIYWFLQSEKCPELYNFVYTNLKSLAESKNPLLRETRINAAQLLRYMRKPVKNYLSGNYIFDYEDPKYEFGAMIQTILISTRTSKSLYIDLTNNIMDVAYQLQSLYLKIDGLDPALADRLPKEKIVRMNIAELEELGKIIMTLPENKNIHIEYAILNQNQVVRIGFFDQSNIRELVNGIQNFQIENLKLLKSSLQIQYNALSQIVMPNDLGLPTILQFKSPKLTNNLINIVREVANKITNIQGEVKLQTSIQSVIDVGIYNPIADIWQGIQRINSYDQIIPINFNLAINSQQNSLKLTLNRNQDQQKDIIGLRNHVRNQVYVIGDEINNFLKQSSSQSNVVQEVTRGKQTKKNVELLSIDDENSGLQYEIKAFDDERQISQRNVVDLLNLVLRPENRNDQGEPIIGLMLSLRNVWSRIFMFPGVGTSGLIIRAVPSTLHRLSQIDLSLRLNQEINREDNNQLPSTKINTRATYTLKYSGDKVLKTWDVNAIVDLNAGHTDNNLKLQISRIIPGEKDYRICINVLKKWDQKGVTGHLTVASGLSADNKCVKDDVMIEINMKGEVSEEQNRSNNDQQQTNNECSLINSYHPFTINDEKLISLPISNCIQRQTVIRKFEYDIKTIKITDQMMKLFDSLQKIIKELVRLNLSQYRLESSVPIEENNMKIIAEYAPNDNEINLLIMRPKESFKISGVQLSKSVLLGLLRNDYHFSRKFLLLQRLGLVNSCVISQQRMINSQCTIIEQENVSENQNEWTDYLRDRNADVKFNVAIRKQIVGGQVQLGLRIVSQDQILEISPLESQYQVLLNGQPLSIDRNNYRQENWFSIGSLNDQQRSIILNVFNYGLFINYNNQTVVLEVAKSDPSLEGRCLGV